jgi:hypothetical protein
MPPVIKDVLAYLWKAGIATVMQLFIVLGVGVILGFIIHHLSCAIQRYAGDILPFCVYAYLFMIPGTVIHELSHWFFAVLFGFRIERAVFFQCEPNNLVLGGVTFGNPKNFIQKIGGLFIGIAPIVLGAATIYGLSWLLLGPDVFASASFTVEMGDPPNLVAVLGQVVEGLILTTLRVFASLLKLQGVPGWQVWLFLYLTYSLSNSMNLSPPDLTLVAKGIKYPVLLLLLANMVLMFDGVDVLSPYIVQFGQQISGLYTIMLFALSLNLLVAIIAVPLGIMFGRHAPR